MKVLFDAYWWYSGPHAVRHVMREILQTWRHEYSGDSLAAVLPSGSPSINGFACYQTNFRPQGIAMSLGLRSSIRAFRPDLVLTQNFSSIVAAPVRAVYLHDLMFLDHPEWFSLKERAYFSGMNKTARFADIVFTSSQTEAARIRRWLPEQEVIPVGLGLSQELLKSIPDERIGNRLHLRKRQFLLMVGRLNIRKNLANAIRGALQTGYVTPETPIVIVGERDGITGLTPSQIDASTPRGAIKFATSISDSELHWLYTNARLLVFMSLDEGFGMPPIEALSLGLPVVASDIPVMREVTNGNAVYANPRDPNDIARAIRAALNSSPISDAVTSDIRSLNDWNVTVRRIRRKALEILQNEK